MIYISFAGAECFVGDRNSMRVFLERATMVSLLAVAGAMTYTRFQKSSNCWRSTGGANGGPDGGLGEVLGKGLWGVDRFGNRWFLRCSAAIQDVRTWK